MKTPRAPWPAMTDEMTEAEHEANIMTWLSQAGENEYPEIRFAFRILREARADCATACELAQTVTDELSGALVERTRLRAELIAAGDSLSAQTQKVADQIIQIARLTTPPGDLTDEDIAALIKPIWLKVQPSREAQEIRSSLSVEFDDPRLKQWVSDLLPDYVWDLVDIAAQRGLSMGKTALPGVSAMEGMTEREKGIRREHKHADLSTYYEEEIHDLLSLLVEQREAIIRLRSEWDVALTRAIEQAEREARAAAIEECAQAIERRPGMFRSEVMAKEIRALA